MRIKETIILFMVLIMVGCGGFEKVDEGTTTTEVCPDYKEAHETFVNVENLEVTDAQSGEDLTDSSFSVFHRYTTLTSEPTLEDTWEIFLSLKEENLFAFSTSINVDDLPSGDPVSFDGFNHALFEYENDFSFPDLLECMENAEEESPIYACPDYFPDNYSNRMAGTLSPRTITKTDDSTYRLEGSYGYYQETDTEDASTFVGFDIAFDLKSETVDLEIDYPHIVQTCDVLLYEYDCSTDTYTDFSCPEGYERKLYAAGSGEDSCHGMARLSQRTGR